MPWRPVQLGHRSKNKLGTALVHRRKETMPVNHRFNIGDHGMQRHSAEVGLQNAQMFLG
jgi:hypothetical protein